MRLKVRTQSRIRHRQLVCGERRGRFHELRILSSYLEVSSASLVCPGHVTFGIELIREKTPCVWRIGFQLRCTLQCGDCIAATASLTARNSKFQVHRQRVGLLAGKRFEHLECGRGLSG